MFRFSPRQILLLAAGLGLILASVFLERIAAGWENFLYPNAVRWQGMRVVPEKNQQINAPGENMLVVKNVTGPTARLTLFLRPDDGVTPQKLVRNLCARDSCRRASVAADGDRAAANYRINGEAMQIMLIRPAGTNIWIEFEGPPDALDGFARLIDSVTGQLARRQPGHPG